MTAVDEKLVARLRAEGDQPPPLFEVRTCVNPACGEPLERAAQESTRRWESRKTCGDATCKRVMREELARSLRDIPPLDATVLAREFAHFHGFGHSPSWFADRVGVSLEALVKAMRRADPKVSGEFLAAWARECTARGRT